MVRTMAPLTGARRGCPDWPCGLTVKTNLPCRTMISSASILTVFGTQICGKAVFFPVQKHDADDTGEMKTAQRNIRNGEHQRTVW